ncbi:MAG: Vms1/Ankzf1 family peptidyl-tRNA hydrolase [Candidatus Zixiibacteriota bacterium]
MRASEDILRELSLLAENERIILSVYIDLHMSKEEVDKWIETKANELSENIDDQQKDYIETSISFLNDYLDNIWNEKPQGIAFFADLGSDYIKGIELMQPPEKSIMILDDEAHIRLLALELDEYEPIGVLMADASGARILLAAGKTLKSLDSMKTDILHLTKVGGWSQMRYQRRRREQVIHFVKNIAEDADKIFRDIKINRILLAGRDRIISKLEQYLPKHLQDKVMGKIAWDLSDNDDDFLKKITPEMEKLERQQEEKALSILRQEVYRGGLASAGIVDTMKALQMGQVDTLFIKKGLDENLSEELTSLAESISAHVEFIPGENKILDNNKGVAALLRYKID